MGTCKTCGKKCDKEYCFQHKPRKQLMSNGKPMRKVQLSGTAKEMINDVIKKEVTRQTLEMQEFFLHIWSKKPHKSEISGEYLGSEALSTYFHHILPKSKYPEAMFDEKNIILLTWEEHDQVEMDMYRYEDINNRREQLKQKYEII
jgi:hypothetical protein